MKTKKIITCILIILWMGVVFYFSNQVSTESSKISGGITSKVLSLYNGWENKTPKQKKDAEKVIRKIAHFSIYTLGGILLLVHMNLYEIKTKCKIIISFLIGTGYAITDEIHQLFIPGRSGEIKDVCIDSLGIITGIIIVILISLIISKAHKSKI